MTRAILAIGAALVLALVVIRQAVVAQFAIMAPETASSVWVSHPAAMSNLAMMRIGTSARAGQPASESDLAGLVNVASIEPLLPEPFLAKGVAAQTTGNKALAEQMFRAAERRSPRNPAAHYFLADLLLNSGRTAEGANELLRFADLSGAGMTAAAPYIAAYARDPKNQAAAKALFARYPKLGRQVLVAMAADPANKDAILALTHAKRGDNPDWLAPLLQSMIASGNVEGAFDLWARQTSGASGSGLISDADFRDEATTPPFGWSLTQSGLGLAERNPGGGLGVIYYGSQSGVLARQMLVLGPGRYRLTFSVAGTPAGDRALEWAVTCQSGKSIVTIPVKGPGHNSAEFDVPADCRGQWLTLNGNIQDITNRIEVTIGGLALNRIGGGRD